MSQVLGRTQLRGLRTKRFRFPVVQRTEQASTTAPERISAPTSNPFSTTATSRSAESCFKRIAAASPAGPAPTIATSHCIALRAGNPLPIRLSPEAESSCCQTPRQSVHQRKHLSECARMEGNAICEAKKAGKSRHAVKSPPRARRNRSYDGWSVTFTPLADRLNRSPPVWECSVITTPFSFLR
jgi:hypothetical protein